MVFFKPILLLILMNMTAAHQLLSDAVRDGAFPGGVLVVGNDSGILFEDAVGTLDYGQDSAPVQPDTIYDIASLTKVVVTATLSMMLYDQGTLHLDTPIRAYFPQLEGSAKAAITVRQLLTHSSGFPAYRPFYKTERPVLPQVLETPLEYTPGTQTVYSDMGMILLGTIIEKISGKSLDVLAGERVFKPLEMKDTRFNPDPSLRPRIAPTEHGKRGVVHDENAFAMGGVGGHAGLFSTGRDLAAFSKAIVRGGGNLVRPTTIDLFTKIDRAVPRTTRTLGWDTPLGENGSAGRYFSAGSFGHTGFTGTSIWIDPHRKLFVIFLSNRIYPSRDNVKIREIRPKLHDTLLESLR